MKVLSAIVGGFAGACALTLLHETLKRIDPDAPRMDLLGMDALTASLNLTNNSTAENDELFRYAMTADILCNSLYYSLAGAAKSDKTFMAGSLLGAAAGIGAVILPGPLGLIEEASNRTNKTKLLTMGLYFVGGIVASKVMNWMEEDS
ncbi:MAG: hypothetical protein ACXWW0_07635 [Bacteroidia bacterium]